MLEAQGAAAVAAVVLVVETVLVQTVGRDWEEWCLIEGRTGHVEMVGPLGIAVFEVVRMTLGS